VNHSLLDLLLRNGERQFFLEIKCVTHIVEGVAMFPDAPTLRGRKHLQTLMGLVEQGFDAGILFSVQRPDAKRIRPYHEMDPLFSQLLKEATEKGVRVFTQTLTFKRPDTVEAKANSPTFSQDS
jgi:sugar fermentation stimulation protein A